jgi:hypothetical protein
MTVRTFLFASAVVSATGIMAQQTPKAVLGNTYHVNGAMVNLREGPGTGYAVLAKLRESEEVELLSAPGSWWQVAWVGRDITDSGTVVGYIAAQYLQADDLAGWDPVPHSTGDRPACENIQERYDREKDNFLRVIVGNNTDVVVKLMRIGTYGDECIRVVYVRSGDTYEIGNIPEGTYYLKLAYGMDYRQRVENGQCNVRFVRQALYEKGEERLDYHRRLVPGGYEEPSYELKLNVIASRFQSNNFNANGITEEEFNR